MARTGRKVIRKNIRIPKPLVDEVDRIVRQNSLYLNRQQFVESAIREKIEKLRLIEISVNSKSQAHDRMAKVMK